jgi:hypothetical protein
LSQIEVEVVVIYTTILDSTGHGSTTLVDTLVAFRNALEFLLSGDATSQAIEEALTSADISPEVTAKPQVKA